MEQQLGTYDWEAMTIFLRTAGALWFSFCLFGMAFVLSMKRRQGWRWYALVGTLLLIAVIFEVRKMI